MCLISGSAPSLITAATFLCAKALEQIEEKDYVDRLRQDGMRNFIKYGIACFKKDCKVVIGE